MALESKHQVEVSRARVAFEQEESERRRKHDRDEHDRERGRQALERGDLEILADVLEVELSNENLPIPLAFEIAFDSASSVRIELALPDFEDVPDQKSSLTKTGKLSYKVLARRDRVGIYEDLCTGLAIRIIHETFRVLASMQRVELLGTAEGIDPATGHPREFVAMHLDATRGALGSLDLDQVDASAAFEGLGGRFSLKRDGELEALIGFYEPFQAER